MHKITSRKIVAYGKDEGGGSQQVSDKLSEGEYGLLYAVLTKARRTCKERIDYITYEPRIKRIIKMIETLDFDIPYSEEQEGNDNECTKND